MFTEGFKMFLVCLLYMLQYNKIRNFEITLLDASSELCEQTKENAMIILGVDPGIATVGYGIIEVVGNNYRALDYGTIVTGPHELFPDRLQAVYNELSVIIETYNPSDMAIEELFFNKNVKTAIMVGHARGVEILAGVNHKLDIFEYTPLQIKQAVVGYGRAEKHQVQEMVKLLLNLKEIPKPDDAADALAVALCHGSSIKFKESFRMR